MEEQEWLKPIDVGRRLGEPTKEVYRLIDEGVLVAYKFGRVIRLLASDVDDYLRHHGGKGRA